MDILNAISIKQVFADASDVIGVIQPSVALLQTGAIDPSSGKLTGVITLLNSILKLVFIVGGIWAFFNFIIAGYGFMSAGGEPKNITKAWDRIWQSFMGLVFLVGSFLLAAIAGILLFHDPTAILQPSLGK